MFEKDYQELLRYAKNNIKGKNIEPEDVISESYILFIESEKEYSFDEFKKIIFRYLRSFYEEKTNSLDNQGNVFGIIDKIKYGFEDHKRCKGECGLLLPNDMFPIY